MRVFLVDKYGKNYDLVKRLNENGIENIEVREDCKAKTTKNDFIILIDNFECDGLSKNSKIVMITKNKDSKIIWKFINTYNCVDIIDESLDRDYIVNRIISNI